MTCAARSAARSRCARRASRARRRADRPGRRGAGRGERRLGAQRRRQPAARRSGAGATTGWRCRSSRTPRCRARPRPAWCDAIEQLSGGALAAIPFSGPWTASTLGGLFELVAGARAPGHADRQPRHAPPVGRARARAISCSTTCYDGERERPAARLGRGALRLRDRPRAGPGRQPLRRRRHLPLARAAAACTCSRRSGLAAR